ncbi:MAG: ABC transporter permease [Colwellia sp.]
MSVLRFLMRTSWIEFRAGVSSGIVSFTFIGLSLYLALTLLNAEYMQQLGATDVTRNAATVIYMMVTGFMFFLFFAYAWIFAQPILRDRNADLHEIVLTMPISMSTLLWGRFIGASLTGIVLASSVLFGFTIAPLIEWAGWLPAGSFSNTPWDLYAFSLLWLIIPTCVGIGAIYMMMTILTRSIAGSMGAAVILILLWMFSATILVEGDINSTLANILDPSMFSFVLAETQSWTPMQKQSAFLPLSDSFLLNRALWGLLPVALLAVVLLRVSREHLVSNNDKKSASPKIKSTNKALKVGIALIASPTQKWMHAFFYECRWQLEQVIHNRAIWLAILILLCVGISNTFIHVIWHAEGPLLPDPGMMQSALGSSLHLVIVFIIAGIVGTMCRRDHIAGIDDMLGSLRTPNILRPGARAVAVIIITILLTITPALSAIIATLIVDADYLNISYAFGYQILVILPSQIECAMVVFFVHALIRRSGLAYGASMFAILIIVANHELELINYPPFELSIPARITFSPLTGWEPWFDYVLLLGAFKVMLSLFLFSMAVILLPRGKDSRLEALKRFSPRQLISSPAIVVLIALLGLSGSLLLLNVQLIDKGGYKTVATERNNNAQWEKLWRKQAQHIGFNVQGGNLQLSVDTEQKGIEGHWQLDQLETGNGVLYAQAPEGMQHFVAFVNGEQVAATIEQELIALPLKGCTASACSVTLNWKIQPQGWSTTATIPWITTEGIWAHATQLAPTLGINPDKVLRAKLHRESYNLSPDYVLPSWEAANSVDGIAPSARWHWQVELVNSNSPYQLNSPLSGSTTGPLEVLIFGGKQLQKEHVNNISVLGAMQNNALNKLIAEDTLEMQRCVERRLQTSIEVTQVVRTPNGDHLSKFANSVLQLSEAPHWHVAANGVGHMMRKAEIARLLARRHIINAYPLRKSSGSMVLSEGLSGAIGLLCVGDINGAKSLADVAKRYAEATSQAITSSAVPVEKLKYDLSDGWAKHYSPLALLAWTANKSPEELALAISKLSHQLLFDSALEQMFGKEFKQSLLGAPSATSFEFKQKNGELTVIGQRRQWLNGGWQPVTSPVMPRRLLVDTTGARLSKENNFKILGNETNNTPMLVIDEWPAYQPSGLSIQHDN